MNKTIPAIILAGALAGLTLWAYTPPDTYVETDDRVFTNVGQRVELQSRMIGDWPNPLFVPYRNANSRVWTKDKDDWEVVWRIKGSPATEQIMASGLSSCKEDERQPIYVRVRIEEPTKNVPSAPVLMEVSP